MVGLGVRKGFLVAAKKKTKTTKKKALAKKKVARKPVAKKTKKAAPAKRASKKAKSARKPPMHEPVDHPELEDEGGENDEVFEIFRTYDRDASGSIDRSEFSRLLEALGMEIGDDELTIALSVVDANDSGKISWDEFKAWWASR